MKEITKVFKNRIMLAAVAGSASLVPLAGISALTAGTASANPSGIKCTSYTGTVNLTAGTTKFKFSGCTGNTGGTGKARGTTSSPAATIKWTNTKRTGITQSEGAGTGPCPSGDSPVGITGSVTSDTTGSTAVGKSVKAQVCFTPAGTFALVPGTKLVIKG
jgi:hypothetical protein